MPLLHPIRQSFLPRFCPLGFTLLEALVVLLLLGILVALAAPVMSDLQARHRLHAQAGAWLDSLVLARTEALRRQQRVTLCSRGGNTTTCDGSSEWQNGWLVFADDNDNAAFDAGEALIETHDPLPSGVWVGVSSTLKGYFSYGAEGRSQTNTGAFMAGTWRFCRDASSAGWQVVVNALGKPRMEPYEALTCP
jgi:type IV fimbrial biogenesis protein FimT